MRILLPFTIACFVAASSVAGEYHVAQRASEAADTNPGTLEMPFLTIARAASTASEGDTVVIHTGVYREAVKVEASGTKESPIIFQAAPNEHVVVTGSDIPQAWTREPGEAPVYSTAWPHRFITWNERGTHPADDHHALIGRAEQVFVDGYLLHQVLQRAELSRGSFWADLEGGRLYVWDATGREPSPQGPTVEASVRQTIWESAGDYIQVVGIRFRHAATQAQQGMVCLSGDHNLLSQCRMERGNSDGLTIMGEHCTVENCILQENGNNGFEATKSHYLRMTRCVVRSNNIKNFNRNWGGGGDKLVLCKGVVIEHCIFTENRGTGVWFDIGNEDCTVRNCLITDNENAGLFYEISYGLHAHDNIIAGNGFAGTPGAWGADGAIALSSSQDCLVERNLLVGNKEGLQFREQRRTTPRIEDEETEVPIWNKGHIIRQNIIAYNRDAQIGGWFTAEDQRHWPRALQEALPDEAGKPGADMAAEYLAKDTQEGLPGSLDELDLSIDENLYAFSPGSMLYQWGPRWSRNKGYVGLEEVTRELGFDTRSTLVPDIPFSDPASGDYQLPEGYPAPTGLPSCTLVSPCGSPSPADRSTGPR